MSDDVVDGEKCTLVPHTFNNVEVLTIEYDGRAVLLAQQVGEALGYADPSKLANNVIQKWADDFEEGRDFIKLTNGRLAAFKAAVNCRPDRAAVDGNHRPDRAVVDPRTPNLILLTESGAQLAAILSRTAQGRAFRRWLVDVVLPERRKGRPVDPPAPLPRKIKGGALHPEAADVLRAGLEEVTRGGGLSDEGRARLAQLVDHLSGTRVRALLAGPRSDAQRIEDEIRAALGPEPSESFRAISWNVTKDFLLRAALARGTPPDAEGRLLVLLQRKHAIDAWLDWQRKHGRISETAFTHLVKMLEGAVSLACGPLPGLS